MKRIYLLLSLLSITTARVYPRTGANDVFDGIEGVIYDVPEYQDPEVTVYKLLARGIMPVFTVGDVTKNAKDSSNKDDKSHYQTDDIKKGLDAVISQLQEAKNKLENGNNEIYLDINKSVLQLESLKHQLYLDLHTSVSPEKISAISGLIKQATDKVSKKYSALRASLKKYLSSDDSIYKYLLSKAPNGKPSSDTDAESVIPAESVILADSVVVPYVTSGATFENSPDYEDYSAKHSYDSKSYEYHNLRSDTQQILTSDSATGQPSDIDKEVVFKYQPLSTSTPTDEVIPKEKNMQTYVVDGVSATDIDKQILTFDSATGQPSGMDKEVVFKYQPPSTSTPPDEVIPKEKNMQTYVVDEVSATDADKIDAGEDKTLIRKKWSMKLSSFV